MLLTLCREGLFIISLVNLTGKFKMVSMVYMSYRSISKKYLKLAHEQTLILVVFCVSVTQIYLYHKEWSVSNQTRHGVSHVYLESKTKRIFAIACLGKKFVFHTEICD